MLLLAQPASAAAVGRGEHNFRPPPRLAPYNSVRCFMALRNSPNDIRQLADLNQLSEIVVDKRLGKRAEAKKNHRNRHYEKQFIKSALTAHLDENEG